MNEPHDNDPGGNGAEPSGGRGDVPAPRRQMSDEQFEALLGRALRVDVPEREQAAKPRPAPRRRFDFRLLGVAAGIVLAIGLTLNVLQDTRPTSRGDLVSDLMDHVHHEPAALVRTTVTVSDEALNGVMQAAGVAMTRPVGSITYVKLCPFRGEMVAHFALQGEAGPVTVLLLPNEEVSGPMPVDEDGFKGTIAPLSIGGSIAVVGEPGEQIEDIQSRVADAVRWRL